jgi:hypothetical protein
MVGENVEARVAGREDAGNGDMMYSGDLRCTMTTGESVRPSVQLQGTGAAGDQGSTGAPWHEQGGLGGYRSLMIFRCVQDRL